MPKYDTSADRRQSPRTKLVEIAYIGMGPENGGLVLDVSDGGLSFHSVAPVQRAETVRFLLSLRGHSRIEGAGEVVWTNEMKTVCGLKFTALSSGAREHLNNWTNQSRPAAVAVEEPQEPVSSSSPVLQAAPVEEIEQAEEVEQIVEERSPAIAASALPVSAEPQAIARMPETFAEPAFAVSPAREFYLSAPLESTSFWQSPVLSWLAVGLLTASLTAAAYLYGVRVGQSQRSSTPGALANSGISTASALEAAPIAASPVPAGALPESTAPASLLNSKTPATQISGSVSKVAVSAAPVGVSVPGPAMAGPAGTPTSAVQSAEATGQSPRPATEKHVPTPADLLAQQEAGKAQLAAAMSYLNGDNGKRDTPKAVQLLWAAVRNGNSDAEVTLSDLYVTGDGVEKNCEQARVLLKAATKSGNPAGMVKLGELETGGCQ
ncbi:MAG TPA: PilZ domain-containing protein [Candidatus Acidoferrales bacterium]|nr:PilZ domain-containing protein [Candidatus Acidoferrales bacterium]